MSVKTKADAIEILEQATKLKEDAEVLMLKHGITDMLNKADEMKREATKFAAAKGIDKLDLSDGRYGKLITSVQDRIWVGTKDDMPEDSQAKVKPLKSLVSKEVWMKLTRRVPDPERIDQAVSEGLVTHDEIAPAYYEKMRAPYIRVFGDNNGEA